MKQEPINKDALFSDRWFAYRIEVLRSPVLSLGAKVLYGEIVSYFWQDNAYKAFPSQKLLAENLNHGLTTIKTWLKELVSVGVIQVRRPGLGKNNEYFLFQPDPARLSVKKDEKGNWKPVVTPDSPQTDYQDGRQTDYQDSPLADYQDGRQTDPEKEISGGVSLGGERVSAIEVSREEEVSLITNMEEEVSSPPNSTSLIHPDNFSEIYLDMEGAHIDGLEDYSPLHFECPACGEPIMYEQGKAKCISCAWVFGYRKFKERFGVGADDDGQVSDEQAVANVEKLLAVMAGNLSSGGESLGEGGELPAVHQNGQNGESIKKLSKEALYARLKRMDMLEHPDDVQ